MFKTSEKVKAFLLFVAFFIIGWLSGNNGWRIVSTLITTQFFVEWLWLVKRSHVIKKVMEGNDMPEKLKKDIVDFIKTIDPDIGDDDCGDPDCLVHGHKHKKEEH